MAKKGSFSKVYDKNGDHVDVEAVRFDGTRTFQMQGDVTASQTWNGDPASPLTLNASIGAKKVTQDKIGDKAVGSGQMADGSVGLTQMDPNAMTSSATSGDTRLITAGGVRTEIDNAILNRGKDYGPMTPTQINAISETIPTGSTVHVTAAGTITDGDIEVRQGEDLKYYRSGDTHYWYSMDGDFKLKQQAKTSPTASGSTLEFIDSITQDENGEITATKKAVQDGTTSQKGVVQLEDSVSSTSTTKAATPNSVKSAYDLANTANTGLANKLDKTGDGKDVTVSFSDAPTRENIGTGEKLSVMFGKIKKWFTDLKALAFKDTVSDSDISGTISDNHIASASTWNGKADKVSGATNGNFAALDSNGNLTDSGKKATDFVKSVKIGSGSELKDDSGNVAIPVDSTPTAGSNNLMTSGSIRDYLYNNVWTPALQGYGGYKQGLLSFVIPSGSAGENGIKLHLVAYLAEDNQFGFTRYYIAAKWRQDGTIVDGSIEVMYEKAFNSTNDVNKGKVLWSYDSSTRTIKVGVQAYAFAPTIKMHVVDCRAIRGNNIAWTSLVGTEANFANTIIPTSNATIATAGTAVGSASVPVYAAANGHITPCTDDFVHDGDVTSTYSATGTNPVNGQAVASAISGKEDNSNKVSAWQGTPDDTHYPSEKLVKDGLDGKQDSLPTSGTVSSSYAINISGKSASATNWSGQISGLANSVRTKRYMYIGRKPKSAYGCLIGMLTICSHTDSKDVYVIGSGWSGGNFGDGASVQRISSGGTDAPIKICLYNHEVTENGTTYSELWCYIPTDSGEVDFAFRQLFNYNSKVTFPTGIVNRAESEFTGTLTKCANSDSRNIAFSPTNTAKGSTSVPVYVKASGEIAVCTNTFVNDIAYVANQSGGGGNLNKTINGTPTSVLTFMTDSEAVSIWADAKTAAANAS